MSDAVSQANKSNAAAAKDNGPPRQQFNAMAGDRAMAMTIDSHSQRQVCNWDATAMCSRSPPATPAASP